MGIVYDRWEKTNLALDFFFFFHSKSSCNSSIYISLLFRFGCLFFYYLYLDTKWWILPRWQCVCTLRACVLSKTYMAPSAFILFFIKKILDFLLFLQSFRPRLVKSEERWKVLTVVFFLAKNERKQRRDELTVINVRISFCVWVAWKSCERVRKKTNKIRLCFSRQRLVSHFAKKQNTQKKFLVVFVFFI